MLPIETSRLLLRAWRPADRLPFARLNADQAMVAYEESAFAARALLERIGSQGLAQLLQDLSAGLTMEQAIERFGITFVAFESGLARRVGAKYRAADAR